LYIDVGGGSTELSLFSAGELMASKSFNIGTIRILDNQDTEETWNEMKDFIASIPVALNNMVLVPVVISISCTVYPKKKTRPPITFAS
jgi:ethanolamine utilization protein EutA (predicted chaperonin)